MQYNIKLNNPLTHLIDFELTVSCERDSTIDLVLPLWRPGRYEAANYSKNIKQISFSNEKNAALEYQKPDANTWHIETQGSKHIKVRYQYYAFVMDAGNSWYDEDLIYINFINCLLYAPDKAGEPCGLSIDLPKDYQLACGLNLEGGSLMAENYYEIVDNPLMASKALNHLGYEAANIPFHIWINGSHDLDAEELISDFKKFSESQIKSFGEFPESEYHFLIIVLPYKHYHGVEHAKSTVICIGPGSDLSDQNLYKELLGVCSHELFHAWNIIKIRPKEMMPYDFARPVTFPTGFVAEGFTTYYGDLYLSRSHVFDIDDYFNELNTLFTRHFWNYGRLNESVITSSLNLWIDGYTNGAPHKKSSIYVEGAMTALILDLLIRKETNQKQSLDDVMKALWLKFGKTCTGYAVADIQQTAEVVIEKEMSEFFNKYVYGRNDKYKILQSLLSTVGCKLKTKPNSNFLTRYFGIRTSATPEDGEKVIQIAPDSIGENYFSIDDVVTKINHTPITVFQFGEESIVNLTVVRSSIEKQLDLDISDQTFYDQYSIQKISDVNESQRAAFYNWTGHAH